MYVANENEFLNIALIVLREKSLSNFDIEFMMRLKEIKFEMKKPLVDFSANSMFGWEEFISLQDFFDQSKNYVNSNNEATIELEVC